MNIETRLYAVVDIETTGGRPSETKIMEIAICISDGSKILEEYSTLIQPGRKIDFYVKKLTGISDEMVADAPLFIEKADEIAELLKDKIFVAHNVDFDYGIVKREFLEIGRAFDSQKLCTVKSARKVFPGRSSYSLGNITEHLGIELTNAHRALDDTMATAHLLHRILEHGDLDFLQEEIKHQNHLVELPEHWTIRSNTPIESKPGIIYFHDEEENIIYIESAKNVQKEIYTFVQKDMQSDALAKKVAQSTQQLTINYVPDTFKTEIKGMNDIQVLRPKFNKVMKAQNDSFMIHIKTDEQGLCYLNILKRANLKEEVSGPIILSNSFRNAEKMKQRIMYSQDLVQLPGMKKQILKISEELKHKLVSEYNNLIVSKVNKEYCCSFENGYFVFEITPDRQVEAVRVQNFFIHSWGQGILENNQVLNYKSEFDFDTNQKLTRKFLNILPKTSYKVFQDPSPNAEIRPEPMYENDFLDVP